MSPYIVLYLSNLLNGLWVRFPLSKVILSMLSVANLQAHIRSIFLHFQYHIHGCISSSLDPLSIHLNNVSAKLLCSQQNDASDAATFCQMNYWLSVIPVYFSCPRSLNGVSFWFIFACSNTADIGRIVACDRYAWPVSDIVTYTRWLWHAVEMIRGIKIILLPGNEGWR